MTTLNTTYNELSTLCVENNLVNLTALSKFLEYPYEELFQTVKKLSKDGNLFQTVKQELFKQSDWFNNDYDFAPDEQVSILDESDNLMVTSYGVVLERKTIKSLGKEFCKLVEVSVYVKNPRKGNTTIFERKVDGKPKRFNVARLVAEAFVPRRISSHNRVKNISGNAYDTDSRNLMWY